MKTLIEQLISRAADVDRRDSQGSTALHHAVRRGLRDTTDRLLEKGANVHARDDRKRGISQIAYFALSGKERAIFGEIWACDESYFIWWASTSNPET
jgi:hypothetical protein